MRISSFRIKNFKGIADCSIDLQSSDANETVVTLIGLNESGKTTILEALASFIGQDQDLSQLVGTHRAPPQLREWVPKHEKANFSGKIDFIATVALSEADKDALVAAIQTKHYLKLNRAALPNKFTITKSHEFENSEPKKTMSYWDFHPEFKKTGERKYREANSENGLADVWQSAVAVLTERLPRICYFPTLLFELPERIYIEGDTGTNKYFRQVLSDVLSSSGKNLKMKEHILDRIKNYRAGKFEKDTKAQLDAVFSKMSSELNRVIFDAWNDIFQRRPRNKKILLEWHLDGDEAAKLYCQFYIQDGNEKFAISERSLGFRWFFCFLLFTQFNSGKGDARRTYFLFDEPAANLHALAQLQLLASFPKVSGEGNLIVYSTHSHYMIEPLWLDRAYVVLNGAIDYDSEDFDGEFSPKHTQITADKYRNFVGQHPERTSYYQPVLDRLDYVVSPLIGSKCCLIVEGKQDYAAFKYFLPRMGCENIDILPGTGAGTLDVLVSLFVGWGRQFLIVLDDDNAGRISKSRYLKEYALPQRSVKTLGDIGPEFQNKKLEDLFSEEFVKLVQTHAQLAREPGKKDFATFFGERLSSGESDTLADIDEQTLKAMTVIANFVRENLESASSN